MPKVIEVKSVLRGKVLFTTTDLSSLPAGFNGTLWIVLKVTATDLTTLAACFSRALLIGCEVA